MLSTTKSIRKSLLLVVFVGIFMTINAKFYSESIARDHLVRDLFSNYDPGARPAPRGQKIDVVVNLELQHFEFNDADGAFQFHGQLYVSWYDPKLRWAPKDYNNISRIHVNQNTLWVPDMEIYNNAPDKFVRMQSRGMIMLRNTGNVLWANAIEMTVFCSADLRHWPHDRHSCKFSLGSWTHGGSEIDIVGGDTNMSMNFDDLNAKNTEFRVLNYKAVYVGTQYSCCVELYINIDYHLEFERRAGFAVIIQMPAFCIVILTLAAFCLEPQRSEKLLVHGVSLLIIVFHLIYFAKNVVKFGRNLPLIAVFYSISFVLVTFATMLTVFALSASRSKIKSQLPPGLAKFLKSRLGTLLDSYPSHGSKVENAEMHSQFEDVKLQEYSNLISTETGPDEWTRFAVVVTRCGFFLYFVIFIILGISCFA